MNIKQIAKEMTRKEFLESEYVSSKCPGDVEDMKLKGFTGTDCGDCNDPDTCQRCWNQAIKNINFKDDIVDEEIWNKFIDHQIAIRCTSEDEATKLLQYCDNKNLQWSSGGCLLSITCYQDKPTYYFCEGEAVTWDSNANGCKIMGVEEFLNDVSNFNTSKMILMINQKPKLKFKRVSDGLAFSIKDGHYCWNSGYEHLAPGDKWVLIKEKPVSFKEAIKAYYDDKIIECHLGDIIYVYTESELLDQNGIAITPAEILKGIWYIKA